MVELLVAGDLVPTKSNLDAFARGDVGALMDEGVRALWENASARVFNLEAPLFDGAAPIAKCGPNLQAPVSAVTGLSALRPDLVCLANNHVMDHGPEGLDSTLRTLDAAGIRHAGAGGNAAEAAREVVLDVGGLTVGFVCCAEHEFSIAGEGTPGAAPYDPLGTAERVAALAKRVDFVVVLYHGGREHYPLPSPELARRCRNLAEHGAAAVVCQHSHCIGCGERHAGCAIVYGQGNFIFDLLDREEWRTGLFVRIRLDRTDGCAVDYVPFTSSAGRVRLGTEAESGRVLAGFRERSLRIAEPGFLEAEFRRVALEALPGYLAAFHGENRLRMVNYLDCESHREFFLGGLREEPPCARAEDFPYVPARALPHYADYGRDVELHRPLRTVEVERGVVLPAREIEVPGDVAYLGGVLDAAGGFVPLSATLRDKPAKALLAGYPLEEEPEYVDEVVIYGGILYEFFGHVLTESMSRLWRFLRDNPEGHRVVFDVVPRARGKFRAFFDLLGIPYDDTTFITRPTRYRRVVVPEQALRFGCWFHRDGLVAHDRLMAGVRAKGARKVFFSRLKLSRNPVFNEGAVMKVFRRNGFKVVYPETLPLAEQIAWVKGADVFVCWAGTLACQAVFCRPGTERVILNRAVEPALGHQAIDQARGLRTVMVDCSLNPLPVKHVYGPWLVGVTEGLKRFCGDRGYVCPGKVNAVPRKAVLAFLKAWAGRRGAYPVGSTIGDVAFGMSRLRYTKTFRERLTGPFERLFERLKERWMR